MLNPGDVAPEFEIPNADLELVSSSECLGKSGLVLYFYPKDDTPGCTIESIEFSDLEQEFADAGFLVFGVSRDNCQSHGAFRDKHGLSVKLLADVDGVMCRAYDVWRVKEAHGQMREGIMRSTFIVDRDGKIRHAIYDVKPKGHAQQVLEMVRALN